MSDERQTNCSSLLNIKSLFVSASSMAIDESYVTSLSENAAMIGHSHQRIQDGHLHISPHMSNRNESTNKMSFDLERTHNGKSSVLRKRTLDSKYGGFDMNVCDRAVKHKKTFCDIRRNVKEGNRRFYKLWMLPKWLRKKVRWKIWTKFTKKNDQERRDGKRKKFVRRRHSRELKQRGTIFSYGKTVIRYKIEKNSHPLRHEWATQKTIQFDTRRDSRKSFQRETTLKCLGHRKKKESISIALWKHTLSELHFRNQSHICRGNSYIKSTIDKSKIS